MCRILPEGGQSRSGDMKDVKVADQPTALPTRANADVGQASNVVTSPVRKIDPVVRALNTIMYGLVVHFGTLWTIELSFIGGDAADVDCMNEESSPHNYPGYLLAILFLHEYWVYLQHSNVLGNPLLQHLDRQYGIALLRSNKHWSIAGTLCAYWMRETLGMFLCLPFLQPSRQGGGTRFSATQYLILYSLAYHTAKSRGVRRDALERSSPRFGIMRLVIDKFYTHSYSEAGVTSLRIFLQGLDTVIHFRIVRDLVLLHSSRGTPLCYGWFATSMHALFVVWVVHAALNQLFRCSTASVMVQTWHSLTAKGSKTTHGNDGSKEQAENEKSSDEDSVGTESISSTSAVSSSENGTGHCVNDDEGGDHGDFVVRQLLHQERVDDALKGPQGAASRCVEKAVRLETAITILASFFMLGLGEVPLRILSTTIGDSCVPVDRRGMISSGLYAWLLWGLLYGIWSTFLRSRRLRQRSTRALNQQSNYFAINRRRSFIHVFDLAVMIGIATHVVPPEGKWTMLPVCAFLTGKVFLQSAQIQRPQLVWKGLIALEFALKLSILRMATGTMPSDDFASVSSALAALWALWVVSNAVPTPCEVDQSRRCETPRGDDVVDAVFLGHPAHLSDAWALWLLPYPLEERWRTPCWAKMLWPFHYLVGYYVCNYRAKLFGDGASFFCCDDVYYGQKRMQNWVASHFGRHFVTHPRQVKENIEAAARHAERTGVKVLCLGALNKAESINGGGTGVVKALGPDRRLSVIHGNHLTAAAVVETIHRCFRDRKVKLFLTGASSKVGWAVAQALRDRFGHDVLCHSTDPGRRKHFAENGFGAASTLAEGTAHGKYWIVGKYDVDVARFIPQDAVAVVFSVPHSLRSRRDVRVIEAGTLHMNLTRLDRPRLFTNKLKEDEIFACHAASVVAAHRLDRCGVHRIDEVGPVDPREMDGWLDDAEKLGFSIPHYEPVPEVDLGGLPIDKPPVVIVGAGPSGLAVAAGLSRGQVPHVVLEAEEDPDAFGSWGRHFAGLEITTQKKWCNLPGFPMSDGEYPDETVTADEYQSYLKQYAHRYAINIRRGARVESIQKGTEKKPYIVKLADGHNELAAWSVVVATGKHRIPRKNTSDDVVGKLESCGIPHVHSTDMCDDSTWVQAIRAAQNGRLCIVGFGNSAADLATMILQSCETNDYHGHNKPMIHIAARTIPPVFPRKAKFMRVDTLGYLVRCLPNLLQDFVVKVLWRGIPASRWCDTAFPPHLKRWDKILGRVPVIDKHGTLASGFMCGRLVGHGPISDITEDREVRFCDHPSIGNRGIVAASTPGTRIDMAILATGYGDDCVVDREDRLNGLYKCGFGGSDRFLPLRSISEDAEHAAEDIVASYHC